MNKFVFIEQGGRLQRGPRLLGPCWQDSLLISCPHLLCLPSTQKHVHLTMARFQKSLYALLLFQISTHYVTASPFGLDWFVGGIKSATLGSSLYYKRDGSGAAVVNSNASTQQSIWILEDTYQGKTFFEYGSSTLSVALF